MNLYAGCILEKNIIRRDSMMQVAKNELLDLVNQMPDECDLEDVQYRLYVLEKIKRGDQAVEEGRVISHEDVKSRLSAKWQS